MRPSFLRVSSRHTQDRREVNRRISSIFYNKNELIIPCGPTGCKVTVHSIPGVSAKKPDSNCKHRANLPRSCGRLHGKVSRYQGIRGLRPIGQLQSVLGVEVPCRWVHLRSAIPVVYQEVANAYGLFKRCSLPAGKPGKSNCHRGKDCYNSLSYSVVAIKARAAHR